MMYAVQRDTVYLNFMHRNIKHGREEVAATANILQRATRDDGLKIERKNHVTKIKGDVDGG